MTTQLDYGIGNITVALQGLGDNWVHIVTSDNGGPLDHSANYPLRAGKASNFEGGYRVVGFVHSPLLPTAVRGTQYPGLLHCADLYKTIVGGIAGYNADWNATGPRSPDSFNVWPELQSGGASPRKEIVHAVTNAQYFPKGTTAMTWDDGAGHEWKLILGQGDSNQVWQAWPTPEAAPVPFGRTSGSVETGTGGTHCVSGLLDHEPSLDMYDAAAAPLLFDLTTDPGEHTNVAGANAGVVAEMTARIAAAGKTGPPPAIVQHGNKTVDAFFCSQARATGYLEPVDWHAPWPTPPPPAV